VAPKEEKEKGRQGRGQGVGSSSRRREEVLNAVLKEYPPSAYREEEKRSDLLPRERKMGQSRVGQNG